jgi:hypothetical protein
MNRKLWVVAIALCLLLLGAMGAGFLFAQQKGGPAPVTAYVVSDPATFPSLTIPANGLVFRNGLFQTPGVDYTFTLGASAQILLVMNPDFLAAGDIISVVGAP